MAVPSSLPGYIKKKQFNPQRYKMNYFVTYEYLRLKCYIKVYAPYYIVGKEIRCSPILARAIANFYRVFNQFKKNYLFLVTYSEINSITISLMVFVLFNSNNFQFCL